MRLTSATFALLVLAACGDDTPATSDALAGDDAAPLSGLDGTEDTATADLAPPTPDIASTPEVTPDITPEAGDPDTAAPADTDAPDVGPEDTSPDDVAAPEDSAPPTPDTTADDAADVDPGEAPITCDNEGFPALSAGYNDFGDLVIMEAYDADLPPFGVLGLEIYDGAVTQAGTYDIYPFNYRDCNLCVRIRAGCSWDGCQDFWVAESGRLVLSSWDTHFTGYLDDVRLRKVTIDPDTNTSTPVAGPGWCVNRFYFNIQAD